MKGKEKVRAHAKGRPVDAGVLEEVRVLLGEEPRRRDLLIEHLHKINGRFGHLAAAHLAALAQEMNLSQTEVYEVATFYHHFDVVKEGESAPPALTVRVCDSIACELDDASDLLKRLPGALGKNVRVRHAPCVGCCEVAPCVVVGQNPIGNATVESVSLAVLSKNVSCAETRYIDYAAYRQAGGYKIFADCLAGQRQRSEITQIMEDSGLRGLGGAGFSIGRK
jgi:formate dehydrogenase beta subunit